MSAKNIQRGITLLCFFILTGYAEADLPQTMNYQGYLTDSGGAPINTPRTMTYRLYQEASGGIAIWEETQSDVPISSGIFNVELGAVNPINVPFREQYYLGLQVQGEASEMSPRHALSNAAYSMASQKVVYQQVLTVAQSGGDTCTVYGALQMIAVASPAPSESAPWVIMVQAGLFNEPAAWSIPSCVTIAGLGQGVSRCDVPGITFAGDCGGLENLHLRPVAGIDLQSRSEIIIRNCRIVTNAAIMINMSLSSLCTLADNWVQTGNSGNFAMVDCSNSGAGLIENNLLDYRGANQPCTGVDAQGINWTIIRGNTFRYCYGSSNTGPRGIRVSNQYSQGRIDHNVFSSVYRSNYCDISIAGTDTYPNRGMGYPGPYGIGNQSNQGPALPDF